MRSGGSTTASYNAFKTTSYSLTKWQGYMSLKEDVSFFLLAIGIQQWGHKGRTSTSSTVALPISFKNNKYAIIVEIVEKDGARGNTTWAKTPTSFVTYQDLECDYIAVGM